LFPVGRIVRATQDHIIDGVDTVYRLNKRPRFGDSTSQSTRTSSLCYHSCSPPRRPSHGDSDLSSLSASLPLTRSGKTCATALSSRPSSRSPEPGVLGRA
jgi:hypothetical protein